MNRFGKILLALFVLVAIAVAAMVRIVHTRQAEWAKPGPTAPPPGAIVTPSGLAIPVAGVQVGQLYDSFVDPRGGGARSHGALDIPAPLGTPVLAAAAGQVEKLFESKDGGHTIYIRSPDRHFVYYYAHLDGYSPDLRESEMVGRGQPIATVGATGDANPAAPHLHFEIKRMGPGDSWYQGEAINPYPLLAGKAASG